MHGRDVSNGPYIISCDLSALLREIHQRHSSNPMDKICAIAFPFMKCNYAPSIYTILPIYDSNTPVSVAWEKLVSSLASTRMDFDEVTLEIYLGGNWDNELCKSLGLPYTATTQLLRLFPHPSKHHWFPSWTQVQQYPDVSVRDSDPSQAANGIDYSLRIMSGRIYEGCSLQLIKPPTPETKAIYCSTVDGKDAQLVATVPGIELDIDSRSKYVLVDISPDSSLWPLNSTHTCSDTHEGHDHLPIWPKSVIIVCEEVDTLECPSADMGYRLRRVTTLEWECGQPGNLDGCWLPFEPSLVHMRSLVCSTKGCEFLKDLEYEYFESLVKEDIDNLDNEGTESRDNEGTDSRNNEGTNSSGNEDIYLDVFCDPVEVASLLSQKPSGWPAYVVYLV